jgi:hypothetical protein
MIDWLKKIAAREMPAILKVDEEGRSVIFTARAVADRPDWMELKIERDFESSNMANALLYLSRGGTTSVYPAIRAALD